MRFVHDSTDAHSMIARNDDEINEIESTRRPGRPPSTKETNLKQRRSIEQTEYAAGMWAPDLRGVDNIRLLQRWRGEWSGLGEIKFCRMLKDGSIQVSAFPPRGGH